MDDPVSEKDLVTILMSSRPPEYHNLITSLETVDEDKLSWTYVRDRAITEGDRKSKHRKQKGDEEAFLSNDGDRGRGRGRGGRNRNRNRKTKLTCHHCHEPVYRMVSASYIAYRIVLHRIRIVSASYRIVAQASAPYRVLSHRIVIVSVTKF